MTFADYIKTKLPFWPNWINLPLMKINSFGCFNYGSSYRNFHKNILNFNQESRLLALTNYAIKNVAYYRNLYKGLELKSISEFEDKIGFIDKDTVMSHWSDFICDDIDWSKVSSGTTGGTSGKPLKLLIPNNRYVFALYFWHRQLKKFGWNYDPMAVIRNHKLPGSRTFIVNPILRQIVFDGFRTDDSYYLKVYDVISRNKIQYLYAYPSSAYAFLKCCYIQGRDLSFLKAAILTSEAITDFQRSFIEDSLGIPIAMSYGHSEKLCSASNVPHSQDYLVDEEYGYTELIDNKGNSITNIGKHGEIVGTTFNNFYFPLIRYKTGDYAEWSNFDTSFPRSLSNIEGRRDNSLIYKADGSTIGLSALNLHGEFYEHISGFQYIQEKKGFIIILIIKDDSYSDKDDRFIRNHMARAMGGEQFVEIRYVDNLIKQSNGKFLPLISKL